MSQIWHALRRHAESEGISDWYTSQVLTEVEWREDTALLKAWQKGKTGYPNVDAGMRELWVTGWMHNPVCMIVMLFLVKDLSLS